MAPTSMRSDLTPGIQVLLSAMRHLAPTFEQNLAFDALQAQASELISKNPGAAKRALVEQNRMAKEVCLTALVNVARAELTSGVERHVTGELTLLGQHQWGAYIIAMMALIDIGFLSEDDFHLTVTEFKEQLFQMFGSRPP